MRLIDVDDAIERLRKAEAKMHAINGVKAVDIGTVISFMQNQLVVDAVPVVHGEWKVLECDGGEPGGYAPYIDVECSNCGLTVGIEQGQYDWAYGDPFPWKCCPFCEAKMDGGNEE